MYRIREVDGEDDDIAATLNEMAIRGVRAEELLDNELLSEAFTALETSYISVWRASAIDDCAGRERLFLAINIVGKVRDHLASIVANGKPRRRN